MDYASEKFIKVYLRDTPDWSSMSWQARGLSLELSRKLDQLGELSLGARGLPAIAALLRAPWDEIAPFIHELIENGRLVVDGTKIAEPGFVDRQTARQSASARKRAQRERDAAERGIVRDVTRGHTASRAVTNVTTRSDQTRSDQSLPSGEDARAREPTPVSAEPVFETMRQLEPDTPLTDARRGMADAIAGTTGETAIDVEATWRSFVDDRLGRSRHYGAESAIDGDWRKWFRRETTFAKQRRMEAAARADAPPRSTLRLVADTPPAPYHGDSSPLERERDRWAEAAGPPDEASAALLRKLIG